MEISASFNEFSFRLVNNFFMRDSVNIIIPAVKIDEEVLQCLQKINKIKYQNFFVTLVLDLAPSKKLPKLTYNINKIVVLYIGDDFRRNVWNMPSKTFVCLANQKKCIGDEAFYGYVFGDGKEKIFLAKISKYRKNNKKMSKSFKKFKRNIMNFILDLNIVYYPKNTLKKFFYTSDDATIKKNIDSLNNLNNKYGDNIIFIQLFTKDEILYGKSYETFHAERYLKTITKNHFICDFEKNINFFYKHDRHPNNLGYDYLFECVRVILNKS